MCTCTLTGCGIYLTSTPHHSQGSRHTVQYFSGRPAMRVTLANRVINTNSCVESYERPFCPAQCLLLWDLSPAFNFQVSIKSPTLESEVTRLLRNYWFRDSQLTPVGPIAAIPWEFRPYLWCGNREGWLVSDVERQKKSDYRERSQTKLSSQSSQIPL